MYIAPFAAALRSCETYGDEKVIRAESGLLIIAQQVEIRQLHIVESRTPFFIDFGSYLCGGAICTGSDTICMDTELLTRASASFKITAGTPMYGCRCENPRAFNSILQREFRSLHIYAAAVHASALMRVSVYVWKLLHDPYNVYMFSKLINSL